MLTQRIARHVSHHSVTHDTRVRKQHMVAQLGNRAIGATELKKLSKVPDIQVSLRTCIKRAISSQMEYPISSALRGKVGTVKRHLKLDEERGGILGCERGKSSLRAGSKFETNVL